MRILNRFNKRFIDKDSSYYQLFNGMSDPEYLSLLVKSAERPTYKGIRLPGLPEDAVQRQFSGSLGEQALRDGYNFYQCVKKYCVSMSKIFIPISKYKEDYDNGKFVHAATGGGDVRDKSYYGETLIPREYIEARFTKYLSLCEFFNKGHPPFALPQALFVMQKR